MTLGQALFFENRIRGLGLGACTPRKVRFRVFGKGKNPKTGMIDTPLKSYHFLSAVRAPKPENSGNGIVARASSLQVFQFGMTPALNRITERISLIGKNLAKTACFGIRTKPDISGHWRPSPVTPLPLTLTLTLRGEGNRCTSARLSETPMRDPRKGSHFRSSTGAPAGSPSMLHVTCRARARARRDGEGRGRGRKPEKTGNGSDRHPLKPYHFRSCSRPSMRRSGSCLPPSAFSPIPSRRFAGKARHISRFFTGRARLTAR